MKLHRLFTATAGLAIVTCLASPTYAFMAGAPDSAQPEKADITAVASGLSQELAAGKTACDVMLTKLDDVLARIDTSLDAGVSDELAYLAARERIVQMRLSLPCLAERLAMQDVEIMAPAPVPGEVIADVVVDEQIVGEEVLPGMAPFQGSVSYAGGGSVGGNFAAGGGGGGAGGGLGGGGGFGLLAAGGIAAAIAIPLALDDDDEPGDAVSRSEP